MDEGGSNPFQSGRANLRDAAKWMVSGIIGAATLIIGTSAISQLGSLELNSARFWCATIALLVAAGLCWIPFERAISVLRSEVQSLHQFTTAEKGEYKQAADAVSKVLPSKYLDGKDLRKFEETYTEARDAAWRAAANETESAKAVADLDSRFATCRDACVSQLVAIRFELLVKAIRFPGAVILLSFLIFSWAANPPKDAVKVFDKPYLENLTAQNMSILKAANVAPACYGRGAQLIAVAGPEAGPQTAVLVGPGCAPRKITFSGDKIVLVD